MACLTLTRPNRAIPTSYLHGTLLIVLGKTATLGWVCKCAPGTGAARAAALKRVDSAGDAQQMIEHVEDLPKLPEKLEATAPANISPTLETCPS